MSFYQNSCPSFPHRADLQGLRAIAVVLVILEHAQVPFLSGGFVGVDVFFVISGYLITGILLKEIDSNGRIDLAAFYARRVKRLLPALFFMMGSVFLISSEVLSEPEANSQLESAPFALTWTSNFYYSLTDFDYFDELAARDVFIHTWSLAVEEQFYLVWPAVLLLFSFYCRGKSVRFFSFLFVVGALFSICLTSYNQHFGFYMMPSRVWQFALGGLVHVAFNHSRVHQFFSKGNAWFAMSLGTLMVLVSAVALHPGIAYPGVWALAPSVGAALVIASGPALGSKNPLVHPILVWIGDRSYSLYLWHWPIIVLGFSLGFQGGFLSTLRIFSLILFFSMLSFRFVEMPFWKGGMSRGAPLPTISVSAFVISLGLMIFTLSQRQTDQVDVKVRVPDASYQWRGDMPEIYGGDKGCDSFYSHARFEPCVFGSDAAGKTVVLLGDSIGSQWFSLIPEIFRQPDWRTVVLTKSACPIVDVDFFYARIGKVYQVCTDWRNTVVDELISLKPDVLIIGSAVTYGFSDEEWIEGTSRILSRLSGAVGTIVLVTGTPALGFDGPGCVARTKLPPDQISRDACVAENRLQAVEPVKKNLETVAGRFRNVHLLDLNDLVCPGGRCNAVSDQGVVVFRDNQHLTDSFVRSILPAAHSRFEEIVSELR